MDEEIDKLNEFAESASAVKQKHKEIKKCPNCGATLSDFVLQCPECGYVFSDESQVSERNRNYLAELHSGLQKIENRAAKTKEERDYGHILKQNIQHEKVALINSFSVPNTKEALIQALLGCYSAYNGSKSYGAFDKFIGAADLKQAWLGKAKEFYFLLQSQPVIDSQTAEVLKRYESLFLSADKNDNKERP